MSGSGGEDWFDQDEDELVHDLEQKVKHQELEESAEHIESYAFDGGYSLNI